MTRILRLIADEGCGASPDIVARLGRAFPEVMVRLVPMPGSDTRRRGSRLADRDPPGRSTTRSRSS